MKNLVFESDSYFELMDYSLTHKILLFRSTKTEDSDLTWSNTDLRFHSTNFIFLKTKLVGGIQIFKGLIDKELEIDNTIKYLKSDNYFEIKNEGKIYYIESNELVISENVLNVSDSGLKEWKGMNNINLKIEDYPHHIEGVKVKINELNDWDKLNETSKNTMIKTFCEPFSIEESTIEVIKMLF